MFDTSGKYTEVGVFGVEILLKQIHFMEIQRCYPAFEVIFEDQKKHTLLPFIKEADVGSLWNIGKKKRFIFSINAFKNLKKSKMTINCVTVNDEYPIATISYDLSPFLADSVAVRGSSPVVDVQSVMKDMYRETDVLDISFELRTLYFNHCLKRLTVTGNVGPLPYEESLYMRSDYNEGTSSILNKNYDPLTRTDLSKDNQSRTSKLKRARSTVL